MVADNEKVVRILAQEEKVRKELMADHEKTFQMFGVPKFGAIRLPLRDEYAVDEWLDILQGFVNDVRKLREARIMDEPQLMLNIHRMLRYASDRAMATPLRNRVGESSKGR